MYVCLELRIVALEDDDYPAHPQKTVTAKSLKKAFEKERMTRQNAEYLVRKTVEYIKALKSDEFCAHETLRSISSSPCWTCPML